jgi:hypothetical protein
LVENTETLLYRVGRLRNNEHGISALFVDFLLGKTNLGQCFVTPLIP